MLREILKKKIAQHVFTGVRDADCRPEQREEKVS